MLGFFEIIENKIIFVELQLPHSIKIMFFIPVCFKKYPQIYLPISLMSSRLSLLLTINKSQKLKIFSILGVTKINFNIESNASIGIKIESDTMLQNLKIS